MNYKKIQSYADAKKRLMAHYRKLQLDLVRLEKKQTDMPMKQHEINIAEIKGYLQGVRRTMSFVESRMESPDLFKREE